MDAAVKTTTSSPKYAILFLPTHPFTNMRLLNRQEVSSELEALIPNSIEDMRVNPRKNVVPVEVTQASAFDSLSKVPFLVGMNVRTIILPGRRGTTGVIYDIDVTILNEDLPSLIKPANEGLEILQVCRIGKSRCVKIDFKSDCLLSCKGGSFPKRCAALCS